MKICNVNEEGRFGGPARRIIQVAKELEKNNVQTKILFPKDDSERFYSEILKEKVNAEKIGITRLSKERKILLRYIYRFATELYHLRKYFRSEDCDLVHVNGSFQFKTAISAKLAGKPVVWHFNDTKMNPLVKKTSQIVARYCANGFIVAGQRVYDYYIKGDRKLEEKPCMEIHAPVNTAVFNPKTVENDYNFGQYEGKKIVTVSAINPTKGLECFVKMAANILERKIEAKFYIAGASNKSQIQYRNYIEKQIRDCKLDKAKIVFIGQVRNVPSFLKGADVVVFTSIAEASPTSVWEAMSMGKAIVTTDVGSVNKYIEEGVSGYVVPVGDAMALSEKVSVLISDEKKRKEMGKAARAVAKKKLDVKTAAKKHEEIYRIVLGHARSF